MFMSSINRWRNGLTRVSRWEYCMIRLLLLKKLVMLCPCRAPFNPGANSSSRPLPQLRTPSRAAGSFPGLIKDVACGSQAVFAGPA